MSTDDTRVPEPGDTRVPEQDDSTPAEPTRIAAGTTASVEPARPHHVSAAPVTDPALEPEPLHRRPAGAPASPFASAETARAEGPHERRSAMAGLPEVGAPAPDATAVHATHVMGTPVPPAAQDAGVPPTANGGVVPPEPPTAPESGQGHGKPRRSHPFLSGLLGGLLACAVALLVFFAVTGRIGPQISSDSTSSSAAGPTVNVNALPQDATTAEVVAAKCLPSVASINVSSAQGDGVGSGVVYDTSGNILTNYHVVDGAKSITVNLGSKSYEGTVVGSDESSDLAVVHVDLNGDQVTPMERGDSSQLVVGEWVMALGSPFGLDQSVSSGIVSSLYRSTILQDSSGNTIYTNLIQTDTAINPGNSGGALVDSEGKLVGINSIIESASGSSSGVGFAIPVNYAVEVADAIIAGRQVEHAYLGASVRTVTPQAAMSNRLAVNQGAYVDSVTEGGPAAQAGIQRGDIITKVDDEDITSADGLILEVRSHSVGDKVKITYYRGSDQSTVEVQLGSDAQGQSDTPERQRSTWERGNDGASGDRAQNDGSSANPFDGLLEGLGLR
ncbi:trypsin-like peptidase domain-containing protein [Atopobiaceae bacterium 24-176]